MGVDTRNMSESEAACAAVEAVKKLSAAIGIPQKLREIGIPKESLAQLAADAIIDPCTGGNPKDVTKEQILELYEKAY